MHISIIMQPNDGRLKNAWIRWLGGCLDEISEAFLCSQKKPELSVEDQGPQCPYYELYTKQKQKQK